jgi:predicted RNA binding protein YcfA (HicA-like mRNA interferase family)
VKIRELEIMLRKAGFIESKKKGKGSHRKWFHIIIGRPVLLSGKPNNDAKPYQIKQVERAIAIIKGAKK